jgi:hypothetical protein
MRALGLRSSLRERAVVRIARRRHAIDAVRE